MQIKKDFNWKNIHLIYSKQQIKIASKKKSL